MTKKDIAKHLGVALVTLATFAATAALSFYLLVSLGIPGYLFTLFIGALSGFSPSGLAAGGILLLSAAIIGGLTAFPFWATHQLHKKASQWLWKDPNFYWLKTPMGKQEQEQNEANLAKEYYSAMILISKQMEIQKKSESQNNGYETPSFAKLKALLAEGDVQTMPPKDLISITKKCENERATYKATLAEVEQELQAANAETARQAADPEALKGNQKPFLACFATLKTLSGEKNISPEKYTEAVQACQTARKAYELKRKQFNLSTKLK